jgi:anti-sigma factor RsiW
MSCSPFDIRDYYLKELTDPQQRQVEAHVKDCPACRQEMDRLRLTEAALFSLREEEIPQRIAFVSDPVFEPSRAQRWWAAFWGSSARLGFAGAALLSAALLFSALTRAAGTSSGAGLSPADVDRRIPAAVASSEARQTAKTTQLVHDLVQRVDTERNARLIAEDQAEYLQKLNYAMERNSNVYVTKASVQGEFK